MRSDRLVFAIGASLTVGVLVAASFFAHPQGGKQGATSEVPAAVPAVTDSDALVRKDRAQLQGAWRLVRTEWNGKVVQEAATTGRCVFTDDHIDLRPRMQWDRLIRVAGDPGSPAWTEDVERVTGTYKLNAARHMTIKGVWLNPRGEKQETFHVLYRLDGEMLTLLLPPPRVEPPDELKTWPACELQLLVFQREPKEQQKLTGTWKLIEAEQDGKIDRRKNIEGGCAFDEHGRASLWRHRLEKTAAGLFVRPEESIFGRFTLDTLHSSPCLTIQEDPGQGEESPRTYRLRYELDGEFLKLLLFQPGQEPSGELKTTAGSGQKLFTYRRDHTEEAAAKQEIQQPPPKPSPPQTPRPIARTKHGWREKATFAPAPLRRQAGPVSFSPDGELLNCPFGLVDLATGKDIAYPRLAGQFLTVFNSGGKVWGLRYLEGTGYVMSDCITGRERATFRLGKGEQPRQHALSPDGKLLAISLGKSVRLWNAATGEALGVLDDPLAVDIQWLAFAPDGKTLAAAGNPVWGYNRSELPEKSEVKLWDVATRKERACRRSSWPEWILPLSQSPLGGPLAMFSADAKRLAFVCPCRCAAWAQVCDASTLKTVALLKDGKQGEVASLALSPDGKEVAVTWIGQSSTSPPPLTIVAVDTGKEIARLTAPANGFATVAFSADGKLLAAADYAGTVTVWARE